MEDDDYLRDLMRGGGSDTSSSESSDGGDRRRGGGVDAGAFAALALDDDDGDDGDSEDGDETPRTSSSSGSSSGSSSSDSETDGDEGEAPGSDADDAATNGWTWSTGAGPGAALTRGATAKKKKPALMPGEKRSLKKRHMAELRATRAEARNGWKPEDVKRELDTLVASGRREWTAPGGGMRTKDAKTIEALTKCYPSLRCEVETSQASGRKKRAYVTVVNTAHPVNITKKGSETDAFVGRGRTVGGGVGINNAEPTAAAAAAAARAAVIAAPVPTRSEFLNDPTRLARLAKFLGKGGTGPRGGDARPRVITQPGTRGSGRRVPPASERGRRGRRDAGLTGRGEMGARVGAPVFSSAGVIDGDAGVNTAVSDESADESDVDVDAAKDSRNPKHPSSYSEDFGTFEAHTTGFGSRIMRRMGYVEGDGLGPDGRGLSEPVSQSSRPKNLGLGATDR